MLQDFASIMQQALPEFIGAWPKDPRKYAPGDVRMAIQSLVSQDQMTLARALTDAALSLYPGSEDILAIAGLIALTNEEWNDGVLLLEELLRVQGHRAPAMTYRMLVRALRCNLDHARAEEVLAMGLAFWPTDSDLRAEALFGFDRAEILATPSATLQ